MTRRQRLNVMKCQQQSRLNENGNEGNEWECFALKSLINLVSHQPLSTETPYTVSQSSSGLTAWGNLSSGFLCQGQLIPPLAPRPYPASASSISTSDTPPWEQRFSWPTLSFSSTSISSAPSSTPFIFLSPHFVSPCSLGCSKTCDHMQWTLPHRQHSLAA